MAQLDFMLFFIRSRFGTDKEKHMTPMLCGQPWL